VLNSNPDGTQLVIEGHLFRGELTAFGFLERRFQNQPRDLPGGARLDIDHRDQRDLFIQVLIPFVSFGPTPLWQALNSLRVITDRLVVGGSWYSVRDSLDMMVSVRHKLGLG
jgi:hypothetical protein